MTKNVRTLSIVVASIILIVGTYLAYEKYTRRNHVVAMVTDTAARLRAALQAPASEGGGTRADSHAAAADARVTALRRMNASSFRPLADAADDYLVTAREILRRIEDIQNIRTRFASSLDALNAHVKGDRGRADWTKEAVRLKDALDKDARDYRIAVDSYSSLLQSFPASQLKIAPFVEHETLIDDETVERARKRTLDAFAAAEQNVRQAANLGGSRR
jgi:hypothetical protein